MLHSLLFNQNSTKTQPYNKDNPMVIALYDIIKALHIISMVAWFAGLFYLPRLFVYHVHAPKAARPMLCTMERKLYRYIMNPAMMATWIFGLWMMFIIPEYIHSGWLHAKIALVILLTGYHLSLKKFLKNLAQDNCPRSERFFRIYNEIPSLLLILIVFLVILKPF